MYEQHSPIFHLGYKEYADYYRFKDRLRVPLPYLWYIVKNNPHTLKDAPYHVSKYISKFNELIRRKRMKAAENDPQRQLYVAACSKAGIPIPMIDQETSVTCGTQGMTALRDAMLQRPEKLAHAGQTLYLHSDQGTAALQVACQVATRLLRKKIPVQMMDFGSFIQLIFDRSSDVSAKKLAALTNAQVMVFYMLGAEYQTDFSISQLGSIIHKRRIEGKTTLLVSALTPADFEHRYKEKLDNYSALVVRFEDDKIKKTIKDLTNLLLEN